MWRKRNTLVLLVGMQTGTAAVENSMEGTPKIKNKIPYYAVIPLQGMYPKKMETLIQKDICIPYVYCTTIYNSQDMEAT